MSCNIGSLSLLVSFNILYVQKDMILTAIHAYVLDDLFNTKKKAQSTIAS